MSGDGGAEMPIEDIRMTIERTLLGAFVMNPQGLTLDDLVYLTGLEKNSISGPRLSLEQSHIIVKTGERKWNLKKNRTQAVYQLNDAIRVVRGGWQI